MDALKLSLKILNNIFLLFNIKSSSVKKNNQLFFRKFIKEDINFLLIIFLQYCKKNFLRHQIAVKNIHLIYIYINF